MNWDTNFCNLRNSAKKKKNETKSQKVLFFNHVPPLESNVYVLTFLSVMAPIGDCSSTWVFIVSDTRLARTFFSAI